MVAFAEEVAVHRKAIDALRAELAKVVRVVPDVEAFLTKASAQLQEASQVVDGVADTVTASSADDLKEASLKLEALRSDHDDVIEKIEDAFGPQRVKVPQKADAASETTTAGGPRRSKSAGVKSRAPLDLSVFTRARWEAERLKGASMMSGGGEDGGGSSGVKVFIQEMPRPLIDEKPCTQVRGRLITTNTIEKIRKLYVEIAVMGSLDKIGFVRSANAARFASIATEKSDCLSAKQGGDMGWITKDKKTGSKFNDVAFVTPKGSCSPPFKSANGYHLFLCEDRKG